MRTPNKMMTAVGALALTATTLLAGCGGGSTEAVPAAESTPAASSPAVESAAAEVPTSVLDGLVQPAGASDDSWAAMIEPMAGMDDLIKSAKPEDISDYSEMCAMDKEELRASIGLDDPELIDSAVSNAGGTAEEWSAVFAKFEDNLQRIACSMAK